MPSIDAKGLNQQGVKLSTQFVRVSDNRFHKQPIARLKVHGTLRAFGIAEQRRTDEQGKQRTLYVIRGVIDKKKEQRSGYTY